MPNIDVAMARSLRPSTWEILKNSVARSIARDLAERDIISDTTSKASDVATTFSSWDNCMAQAYCKWPVIAVIVVGGLIIFSVVWCIIRCCCCGLSCCCSCCQCFKCCGNCCGCCDPPKGSQPKHLDDPYSAPVAAHGYRTEPPMQAPTPFASTAVHSEPPQYAEFETTTKRNSDALPQMPSWEGAGSKKVALEEGVEMQNLKTSSDQQSGVMNAAALSHANSLAQSRNAGYSKTGNASGYNVNQADHSPESYSPIDQQGYNYNTNNNGYAPATNGYTSPGHDAYGSDQTYAAAGAGRNTPAQYNNGYGQSHSTNDYNQYDGYNNNTAAPSAQGYGARSSPAPRRTPGSQDDYGYGAPSRSPAPQSNYGYGQAPSRSPAPQTDYGYGQAPSRSPAPQTDYGYGQTPSRSPAPQTDYGYNRAPAHSPAPQNDYAYGQSNYGQQRTYSPAPEANYGTRAAPQRPAYPADPPQSPITNNSGFDFNSGYSRPQQSPTTQEPYPGYRPYNS